MKIDKEIKRGKPPIRGVHSYNTDIVYYNYFEVGTM